MTDQPFTHSTPGDQPQTNQRNASGWPVVVLVAVSTVVSEMMPLGSQRWITLSDLLTGLILYGPAPEMWTALPEVLMGLILCGSAPLLIREVVRRRGGGWPSLMLFGAGYGAFEYGLLGQDWLQHGLFDPYDLRYAALGVLWTTAAGKVVFTAVWAITLPILLTELVFRDRRSQPWLRRTGMVAWGAVLALGSVALWGFTWADWSHRYYAHGHIRRVSVLGVAVVAAALLAAGWWSTTALRGRAESVAAPAPGAAFAGLVALAGSAAWMGTGYSIDDALPTAGVLLWYLLLLTGSVLLIRVWLSRPGFDDWHRLACYAGALAACSIYLFLFDRPTGADLVHRVVVCVVVAILLGLLARQLSQSAQATDSRGK
ncbi:MULTISPECIES: hypothetical protein [unclassified Nocardia]|uniref:hypothetical protein n=1 Tax=unclassified Nocardia TaxID=2637762 RepID=UPI001CE3C57E|nr:MULTISPECIES: hypothetical protein [unclassified Nocardia]